MSFVLKKRDDLSEVYTIRCDRCSAETGPIEVNRWDIQEPQFMASTRDGAMKEIEKHVRAAKFKRLGVKHLCQACEATRREEKQLPLLDKGPKRPQAWRER